MSSDRLAALAREVLPWVQEAGAVAHSYFIHRELSIEVKGDGSPVTKADKETEEHLRRRLAALGPSYGIVGEEHGAEGRDRDRVWIIDPIDGTRAFTRGLPYWSLLLALMEEGQPVLGFQYSPALDSMSTAWKGGGTTINGHVVRVSKVEKYRDAFVTFGSLEVLERQPWAPRVLNMMSTCWTCRSYGDAPSYLELMRGKCDAVIEPEGNLWDFAALKILVEEAGGKFTDIHGKDTADGGSVLATNGLMHDEILEKLHGR